ISPDYTCIWETDKLASIRQRISGLSLVTKQALAEILHLLPRLDADALELLAIEVENRRRHLGETVAPSSPPDDHSTGV
uniref:XRE family transcriptional regulator n=2 Tax=Mesocestoides corti TaxID=53468 RepID=A0A5K3FJ25_MESCO